MPTKRTLMVQMEQLKQDNAMLKLLTKAYMRRNAQLEQDITVLNASLDAAVADMEKWKRIAHRADKRRIEYVRANNKCS